jgi:Protein of unknown function (DUF3093)
VPGREARPGVHQGDVALGQGERDPGRHQDPLARREDHVLGRDQVCSGIAGMGVAGHREVRIEAEDGDLGGSHWVGYAVGHGRTIPLTSVEYDERLSVPFRWWVQGTMLVASLWLAMIVAVPATAAWTIAAIAMVGLALGLLAYGAARVTVEGGALRAGRARIAGFHLGTSSALDAEATRRISGVEADARAYLLLRPYLKRAVQVAITDPADPAPYWLISTRHPDELARALTKLTESTAAG